jgi:hypothetical protein
MAKAKPTQAFEPYVVEFRDVLPHYYVVLEPSFHAVRAVVAGMSIAGLYYGCHEETILLAHLPDGRNPRFRHTERSLQSVMDHIKDQIQKCGCSPEAVLLLHRNGWLTESEMEMAKEKLETKGAAPKADKTKAAGGGRKGNPEALKKAREARETGPDLRKITILNKENPYREGSGRAASWDALKGAKTVEDYKTAGGKAKYISRWVEEARIKVG